MSVNSRLYVYYNESVVLLCIVAEGAQGLVKFLNDTTFLHDHCRGARKLSDNFESFSPYLYPFTIEYSILVGELSINCLKFEC
jgi:hypothetical protein